MCACGKNINQGQTSAQLGAQNISADVSKKDDREKVIASMKSAMTNAGA